MIYPIVAYGTPVLRQKAKAIRPGTDLKEFIRGMFATLDSAKGLGLAAPQVGKPWQLFVVDMRLLVPNTEAHPAPYRKVYINPIVHIPDIHELIDAEEGCLSIPKVYVSISRSDRVRVNFFDENWEPQTEELSDMAARVIQHEYDHLQGKLFIDYLEQAARLALEPLLANIQAGKIHTAYPMQFLR